MKVTEILSRLEKTADPSAVEGMARFGITGEKVYGVNVPVLRTLAKEIGRDHALALELWAVNSRETRILATLCAEIAKTDDSLMENWATAFDSWEMCDQCIMNLFERHPLAWDKAFQWSEREEEFVKRAGFVMMARLAGSDKESGDDRFETFFPPIIREASDNRNMVKKAVNWALRGIGKRNLALREKAIKCAEDVRALGTKSARWIASDAIRELQSEKLIDRLTKREQKRGIS